MVAPTASFTGPGYYDEQLVPVQFDPFAEELLARIPDDLRGPVLEIACGTVACAFGYMFVPDRQAALVESRRVLASGGLLAFMVWDSIEHNPHALVNAQVIEARFPDDPQMKFRTPYEMCDEGLLRQML